MKFCRLGFLTIALAITGCGGKGKGETTAAPTVGASAHATPLLAPTTPVPIGACCHDPKCDKKAYEKHGGICSGDPRILGVLPVRAMAAPLTPSRKQ